MFRNEDVDKLIKKVNLVDVVSDTTPLVKGDVSYNGPCPFDKDDVNGFYVNEEEQVYFCACCGASGNALSFIMERGSTYEDAVKELSIRSNLPMPEQVPSISEERLYSINKDAARFYFNSLESSVAERYIKDRELTDETLVNFAVGYAPKKNALIKHLEKLGYTKEEMLQAGLAKETEKYGLSDKFYNRVMFPIINKDRQVLGFSGRKMDDKNPDSSKYINSNETPIFKKGDNIFGINSIQSNYVIFCEGQMDAIMMQQNGFPGIASLGTALTSQQLLLVKDKDVYLAYDGDRAGQNATLKAISKLRTIGKSSKIITFEPSKDPDEFIKTYGKDAFQERIDNAKPDSVFRIEKAIEQYQELDDNSDKTVLFGNLKEIIDDICDKEERDKITEFIKDEYNYNVEDTDNIYEIDGRIFEIER